MDKITGKLIKIFFLLVFFMHVPLFSGATLHVLSKDNIALEQAGVGIPFVLEILVEDAGKTGQRPHVKGLDNFTMHNSGMTMTTANGKTSIKYTYELSSDQIGVFKLGPAELVLPTQVVKTNSAKITVGSREIKDKKAVKAQNNKVFFSLFSDKRRVVVGEKVICSLRFYFLDDSISLRSIQEPRFVGFKGHFKKDATEGTQTINGTTYNYIEWQWQVYPARVGHLMIPACRADYVDNSGANNFNMSFASFFAFSGQHKSGYSNALTIEVDALPEEKKDVDAIGEFSHFSAFAKPAVAKEAEGIVFALELTGDGNFEDIDIVELAGVPETFKYYDAQKKVTPGKKQFDFIMQGMQVGDWQVPSQSFTYFDTKSRTYKTLKTSPVHITITPGNSVKVSDKDLNTFVDGEQEVIVKKDQDIHPIITQGAWYFIKEREISMWWFLLLTVLPLIVCVFFGIKYYVSKKVKHASPEKRQKNAFKKARTAVIDAQQQQNCAKLYQIFIELFLDRIDPQGAEVSQGFIESTMQDAGIVREKLDTWNRFFNRISEYMFFDKEPMSTEQEGTFKQALSWIDFLEKSL